MTIVACSVTVAATDTQSNPIHRSTSRQISVGLLDAGGPHSLTDPGIVCSLFTIQSSTYLSPTKPLYWPASVNHECPRSSSIRRNQDLDNYGFNNYGWYKKRWARNVCCYC